jgi:hypothetical protein
MAGVDIDDIDGPLYSGRQGDSLGINRHGLPVGVCAGAILDRRPQKLSRARYRSSSEGQMRNASGLTNRSISHKGT